MSAGGPQVSMREAAGPTPGVGCPYCGHPLGIHVDVHPTATLHIDPGMHILACTDSYRDPITAEETFCDCLGELDVDPGA